MALQTSAHSLEIDLFRQELVNLINNQHPLVQLAAKIDWQACETRFDSLYVQGVGRPGHPIRLRVGLQLLKHTSNLSDEEVVPLWIENPYWQYFCGEQYFYHHNPTDPSLMTGFTKRIDPLGCEFILGLTVSVVLDTTCARSSRSSGFFAPAGDGVYWFWYAFGCSRRHQCRLLLCEKGVSQGRLFI